MIEDELRAAFARHEPDAPDPVTLRGVIEARYRRARRTRTGLRAAAAAVTAMLAVTGVPLLARQHEPARQPAAVPAAPSPPPGPVNLLLLGLDPGDGGEQTPPVTGRRSDTVMIVHIPADRHRLYLVTLDRDLGVELPGYGWSRLNAAYYHGGAPLAAETVRLITGAPIDGTVTVTLDATARIVDAVGPIQVCLPVGTPSIHSGRIFPAGCQRLDGPAVSDLVRQRKFYDGRGLERAEVGQRVLLGLLSRLGELDLLADAGKVAALVADGGDGVAVDLAGGTQAITQLAWQLRGIGADAVTGFGPPEFHIDQSGFEHLAPQAQELFAALRAGTLDEFAVAHPDWVLQR
jgi:LCP family protein required for cell wall assembly